MRAQRQLYKDAGVHIHLRNFNVINQARSSDSNSFMIPRSPQRRTASASISQVGAVSLEATLNCDEFASAHTQSAHYDAKSFVGLAVKTTQLSNPNPNSVPHLILLTSHTKLFFVAFAVATTRRMHLLR